MLEILQMLAWIACVIYSTIPSFWLAIHPRAEYWRSRSRSPYRFLLPMWIGMWIFCGLVTLTWRHVQFYKATWSWIPAAFIFLIGLWTYKKAGAGFSARQLAGLPEILDGHGEQKLVIAGIRRRVRHPIYLGHLCEMVAWSVGSGLAVCYGLTAFTVITGAIMIRMEDSELEKRFGEEYSEYRKKVPALFPPMQ
jgi:protein-S-isoprenylcysteine O-methyltransferase Ste14